MLVISMANNNVVLRYDGRWEGMIGDNRQWTILSHYIAPDGEDYCKSSRTLKGLIELGIVKIILDK